jgi:hypothetical protein
MTGKKEGSCEAEKPGKRTVQIKRNLLNRRANVGQDDKKGTDQVKQGKTLKYKGYPPGLINRQNYHENKEQDETIDENTIDINSGDIIEDNIVDRVAGMDRCIAACEISDEDTADYKNHSPK